MSAAFVTLTLSAFQFWTCLGIVLAAIALAFALGCGVGRDRIMAFLNEMTDQAGDNGRNWLWGFVRGWRRH